MPSENSPHSGSVILRGGIESLRVVITATAASLGAPPFTLSELVNEKHDISPEMAIGLSKVFGGSAEVWLVQQAQYDLAHVRAGRLKLKRLKGA